VHGTEFAMGSAVPDETPKALIPRTEPHPVAPFRGGGGGGNGRPAAPADDGLDWHRYWRSVRRYKWWILLLAVLGAGAGMFATRLLPPRYLAQATIWIQTSTDQSSIGIRGAIGSNDQLLPAAGAAQLLKSYVVLDDVVRDQRLYLHARTLDRPVLDSLRVSESYPAGGYRLRVDRSGHYRLTTPQDVELEHGTVGDSIGRQVGILWAPDTTVLKPGADILFGLSSLRDAAAGIAQTLQVGVDASGNFLRLALVGEDPARITAIVNSVAERYIAVATDLKKARLTEQTHLLADQLAAAKQNLDRAENALAAFRTKTITLTPDPGTGGAGGLAGVTTPGARTEFFTLRVEMAQLRRDREAITRALRQTGDSGATLDALAFIGSVQQSPDLKQALQELTTKRADLRALRYRYTDEHPTVRKLLDDVNELQNRTIPALAQGLIGDLRAREAALAPQIDSGGRELQAIPQRTVEEARLRRDADIAALIFSNVQGRQSEASLAEASSVADVRLLDGAVEPRTPIKGADSRLLMIGLLFGLGLGVIGAVVAERMDPRVQSADQVTDEMGLRMLGMLPHVKNREAGPDDLQVAQLIEAMRSVRLNLLHAYGPSQPLVVTVTSPGVGDGKSFVSTNLALACAQSGQRTLLIDGDSRRGGLHRGLQLARTPGLTDYLAGTTPYEGVVQKTRYRWLHFIAAGRRLRESPELLGSPAMTELLLHVKPRFDVIIVDSPPLGAGVDPCTLGTLTGNMVLVLRSAATHRDIARTHLRMVSQLPIRLLGVVLNDVRPEGMIGYYGYYYLAGYGSEQEDVEEVRQLEPTTETSR